MLFLIHLKIFVPIVCFVYICSEEDTTEAKKKKSAKSEEPAEEADEAEEETTEKSQKKNKSEKITVPDFLDPDAADDADSDAE